MTMKNKSFQERMDEIALSKAEDLRSFSTAGFVDDSPLPDEFEDREQ